MSEILYHTLKEEIGARTNKNGFRNRDLKEKIQKQLLECQQYDQVIAHVDNQKIEIDLDDGVKVKYEKFQNIAVPQGGLCEAMHDLMQNK